MLNLPKKPWVGSFSCCTSPTNSLNNRCAFEVFDFTKEQVSAFLTTTGSNKDLLNDDSLSEVFGSSLASCALKHAPFMCDIDPKLLPCLLQLDPREGADNPFIVGTCNFWEAALDTERFRQFSFKPVLQQAVASLTFWPKEVASLPRVVQIVQRMIDIIAYPQRDDIWSPMME